MPKVGAAVRFLSAILLSLTLFTNSFSWAEEITKVQQETLKALVKYVRANQEELTFRLDDIGYRPNLDRETWAGFPSIRKLEAAYVAANEGNSGGGDEMLRRLAKQVAGNSEAAKSDAVLKSLLDTPASSQTPIKFSNKVLTPDQIRLDAGTQKKILAIVNYADGGLLGGATGILQYEMDLHPDEAYKILRRAKTNAEAITAALKIAPIPPPLAARLAEIATEMAKLSEAVRSDGRMKAIVAEAKHLVDNRVLAEAQGLFGELQAPKASLDGTPYSLKEALISELKPVEAANNYQTSPPANSSGGAPGGTPASPSPSHGDAGKGGKPGLARGASEYANFRSQHYNSPGSRGFSNVIRARGGFGGIVFGSEVAAAPGTQKPKLAYWMPLPPAGPRKERNSTLVTCTDRNDCAAWGRILVRFADDSQALSHMIRVEDAYAASCIVFGGCPLVELAQPGEGIPLVGLSDIKPHYVLDDGDLEKGAWFRVVINPAIDGRSLGRAAVAVDGMATSSMANGIIQLTKKEDPKTIAAIKEWLGRRGATWKITDVVTEVSVHGNRIVVQRKIPEKSAFSKDVAATSFLDFISFSAMLSDSDDGFRGADPVFPTIVPALARSIMEVSRINDFAQVLSLARWIKLEGGTLSRPTIAEPQSHFGSVAFYDGRYSISSESSPLAHSDQSRRLIESSLATSVSALPGTFKNDFEDILETGRVAYVKGVIEQAASGKMQERISKLSTKAALGIERKVVALERMNAPLPSIFRNSRELSARVAVEQQAALTKARKELEDELVASGMTATEIKAFEEEVTEHMNAAASFRNAQEKMEELLDNLEMKIDALKDQKTSEAFESYREKVELLVSGEL